MAILLAYMYLYATYVWCLCLHIYLYATYVWCLCRSEDGIRAPGTGGLDSCEMACGCWESNPNPLEEQPVLLSA